MRAKYFFKGDQLTKSYMKQCIGIALSTVTISSVLITPAQTLPAMCESYGWHTQLHGRSKNFDVAICWDHPLGEDYYMGRSRKDGSSIVLPLSHSNPANGTFAAIKGKYKYLVNFSTIGDSYNTNPYRPGIQVTKNGRQILSETFVEVNNDFWFD